MMASGDNPRVRMSLLGLVVFALFASLFARLWYLQVMTTDQFQVEAKANQVRVVPVEAPRGRILDRNGKVLVDNRISVQLTIDRNAIHDLSDEQRTALLTKVADGLNRSGIPKTVEQLESDLASVRYSPFVPVPVASDVPEELKIWVDEHAAELPGVSADRVAVREYPYGQLLAHVLGYVGKVTQEEYDTKLEAHAPKSYTLNDEIGKTGVELVYEDDLRGTPGSKSIEVDAQNRPIRTVSERAPLPGDDLVLNIDVNLQANAEQALKTGLDLAKQRECRGCKGPVKADVGSTVVLDPRSGAVLAMASYPTFPVQDYVDGISKTENSYLQDEASHAPALNRSIQGEYAPGSTFKPFTAVSALDAGLLTPDTTVYDQGEYHVPECSGDSCTFRNDNGKKYGVVDLRRSLTVSSDVFYYGLGAQFWRKQDSLGGPESFRQRLERFGFDAKTGIDLPFEKTGRIPSPAWLKDYCTQVKCADSVFRTGNSVNMAVGQGDVLLTPLQIANAYAAIGNGGTLWTPHVAKEIRDGRTHEVKRTIAPKKIRTVDIRPEWRAALLDGLEGVTTQAGGTAVGAFSGFPNSEWPVAAKTGTAQVGGNRAPTGVFGAFAPATAPTYAISVLLEESGYGGSTAAPVARRLFDVFRDPSLLSPVPAGGKMPDLPTLADSGDVRD